MKTDITWLEKTCFFFTLEDVTSNRKNINFNDMNNEISYQDKCINIMIHHIVAALEIPTLSNKETFVQMIIIFRMKVFVKILVMSKSGWKFP